MAARTLPPFSPYYTGGYKDYNSGYTVVSANSLNTTDNGIANMHGYLEHCPCDLEGEYETGILIGTYSVNGVEKDLFIPDYQSRIDALEARIAALEGN